MAIYQEKNKNKWTKDGRSWYYRTYYETLQGERKQKVSKLYLTKREATEQERVFLLTTTDKISPNEMTLEDLIKDYLNFQKDKVKITTYMNYNKSLKFFESLYKIKINNYSITHFNQWKIEVEKKNYSIEYKNTIYKILRAILNYGVKYYNFNNLNITLNKMTNFKNPNQLKKEMLFYTYEEFKLFIKEETSLKYKTFFETLYYCGLRKGEANGLTWIDIDFKNKKLSINKNVTSKIKGEKFILLPTKTKGSNRVLPIPNILAEDLIKLYNEYKKYDNFNENWFVFGGIYPLVDNTISLHQTNCEKKAKVKHIRLHDFRHSCASLLINNGASISLVAKYLGHSKISTTLDTYTHLFKNELDDIIKVINNLEK